MNKLPKRLTREVRDEQLYRFRLKQPYALHLQNLSLNIEEDVFPPDLGIITRNLAEKVKQYPAVTALDMGTGSGYIAMIMRMTHAVRVVAIDNHRPAVDCARSNFICNGMTDIELIESDLFERAPDLKFDLMVFAQPYYPSDGIFGLGRDGGAAVIRRFLKDAPKYLEPHGRILMPFSTFAGIENDPRSIAESLGYEVEEVFKEEDEDTGSHFIYQITASNVNKELKKRFDKINNIFSTFRVKNSLLVFNFVIFTHTSEHELDVTSYAYGDCTRFYEVISQYTKQSGYLLNFNGIEKETVNLGNTTFPSETVFRAWKGKTQNSRAQNTKARSEFLKEQNYGGCAITFYYSVRQNIDIGVFLTLCEPFEGLNEERFNIKNAANYAVEALLYDQISTLIFEFGLDYIIKANMQLEQRNQTFERDREYTKAHQHTIRNFSYEGRLAMLYNSLVKKDIKGAIRQIEPINKLGLLRDIAIDCIYSSNDAGDKSLISSNGLTSFIKILQLIHDTATGRTPEKLVIISGAEIHPLNEIKQQYLIDTFNLLINLFSNTRKNADNKPVRITVQPEGGSLRVTFRNEVPLAGKFKVWLTSRKVDNDVPMGSGMRIIVESLNKLPHIGVRIEEHKNITVIHLIVEAYENISY